MISASELRIPNLKAVVEFAKGRWILCFKTVVVVVVDGVIRGIFCLDSRKVN